MYRQFFDEIRPLNELMSQYMMSRVAKEKEKNEILKMKQRADLGIPSQAEAEMTRNNTDSNTNGNGNSNSNRNGNGNGNVGSNGKKYRKERYDEESGGLNDGRGGGGERYNLKSAGSLCSSMSSISSTSNRSTTSSSSSRPRNRPRDRPRDRSRRGNGKRLSKKKSKSHSALTQAALAHADLTENGKSSKQQRCSQSSNLKMDFTEPVLNRARRKQQNKGKGLQRRTGGMSRKKSEEEAFRYLF